MALMKCPECGLTVSSLAETCPHCGYRISADSLSALQTERVGYDVLLVDYSNNTFTTATHLKDILDCPYTEAISILSSAPSYLYTDLDFEDAEYICMQCMNMGIRTALYAPDGSVTYYTPDYYKKALPLVGRVRRKPKRVIKPVRKPMLEPISRVQAGPIARAPKPVREKVENRRNDRPRTAQRHRDDSRSTDDRPRRNERTGSANNRRSSFTNNRSTNKEATGEKRGFTRSSSSSQNRSNGSNQRRDFKRSSVNRTERKKFDK